MAQKNKKIKSRCSNCHQMNKYKKKNWKGKEKTKCNHCGKVLIKLEPINKLKIEKANLCKEVNKQKMNRKTTTELYEAIRPTRNNQTAKKGKAKMWVGGFLALFLFLGIGYAGYNTNIFESNAIQAQGFTSVDYSNNPLNITLPSRLIQNDTCDFIGPEKQANESASGFI